MQGIFSRTHHYILTVFTSAFLVFSVQPMVGKHLLPFFGGSSSVWGATLLFFTTTLFLGYTYVFFISSKKIEVQKHIHRVLLLTSLLYILTALTLWQTIFPPHTFLAHLTSIPFLQVLLALLVSIGVPYFTLTSTAPLLQQWHFSETTTPSWWLYAISNIGSFLALGGYILFFERFLTLTIQGVIWAIFFILYICSMLFLTRTYSHADITQLHNNTHTTYSLTHILYWIFLSALPSFALVATTTKITQTISPVPLLWVIPLALYLLTFVIAFAGYAPKRVMLPSALFASVGAYFALPLADTMTVLFTLCALLFLCMISCLCHGQLYRLRPHEHHSSLLYVCSSLGGALGVFCASVLAPMLLTNYWEYEISIFVSLSLIILLLPRSIVPPSFGKGGYTTAQIIFFGLLCYTTYGVVHDTYMQRPDLRTRNFYGVVSIRTLSDESIKTLSQGHTIHGLQFTDYRANEPTTYFTQTSGAGVAFSHLRTIRTKNLNNPTKTNEAGLRVGIIGLGVGTLASYCTPHDTFMFFEIDSRIEKIAREEFSYLQSCDDVSVLIGDARMTLTEQKNPLSLDLLVLDAFTDDTIPTHLLTTEAFALYTSHIKNDGIIAVHVSNRYLNLAPVLLQTAQYLSLSAIVYSSPGDGPAPYPSIWVLLSKDADTFTATTRAEAQALLQQEPAPLWTDTYTDILGALYPTETKKLFLDIFYQVFLEE